jgi:hypothetical protein
MFLFIFYFFIFNKILFWINIRGHLITVQFIFPNIRGVSDESL